MFKFRRSPPRRFCYACNGALQAFVECTPLVRKGIRPLTLFPPFAISAALRVRTGLPLRPASLDRRAYASSYTVQLDIHLGVVVQMQLGDKRTTEERLVATYAMLTDSAITRIANT